MSPMSQGETATQVVQLPIPGMPAPASAHGGGETRGVGPGQEVMYVGRVSGGPRYGSLGVVRRSLQRKAVVDMGRSGLWHIPYYFLALPQAA